MRKKLHSFYLYTFLILSTVGCRGCSCNLPTTYILETIVEEIQLDSNNIARIKIEHLEKKGARFTFKFKKHGGKSKYFIRYNLQVNDRPYRNEIFEQDANATDSMNQHTADISVKLSPDKLHLLVNYEKEAIGVYHLLAKGKPFTTTVKPKEVKRMIAAFNENTLKSPEKLMLDYVEKTKDISASYNNTYVKETLIAQETPSEFDNKILAFIGLPLADVYFDPSRVMLLCSKNKHAYWRTKATKLIYRYISEVTRAKHPISEEVMQHANGAVNLFTNGLSKYMDKRAIERQVLPKYPYYAYAIKIFHTTEDGRSLRPNEAKAIKKNCLNLLSDDKFREALPDEDISANQAIEFLIRYRDDKKLDRFEKTIAAIFRPKIAALNCRSFEDEILFPYDTRFSEGEQEIILRYAKQLDKELPEKEPNFHLQQFLNNIDLLENPATPEEKKEENVG